jgi:uncharacterized protein YbjQ (UPF0145 family)
MIVVTTETVADRKIARTLGMVKGNTVRASAVSEDFLAFVKNLVGGELTEYTQVIAQAREQALDRMIEEARNLQANAVVGLRFSTFFITHGAAEIMAYGTAVLLEDNCEKPDDRR